MKSTSCRLRRALIASFVIAVALVWRATSVTSAAESFTLHLSNVTETVEVVNPCLGPMVGTLTYDAVIHVTANGDMYHAVVHIDGDAVTVPEDPNEPSFSGQFSETQVLNLNRNNAVSTFTVTQLGTRIKFHITFHLTLDAAGGDLFVLNVACEP